MRKGYRDARIDGKVIKLKEGMSLSRYREHTIELVIGEIPNPNLNQLVSQALSEGSGTFTIMDGYGQEEIFSLKKVCPSCNSTKNFGWCVKSEAYVLPCSNCGSMALYGKETCDKCSKVLSDSVVCNNCNEAFPVKEWMAQT